MKIKIMLDLEKYLIIDEEDYDLIKKYKLHLFYDKKYDLWYVRTKIKGRDIPIHRLLLNFPKNKHIDHIDCNGLNNSRDNLRLCSISQNQMNRRKRKLCSSTYKGVSWDKQKNMWSSEIVFNKRRYKIGYSKSENEAAILYNKKASEFFGDFAKPNIINQQDRECPENHTIREKKKKYSNQKGISFCKDKNKWECYIRINKGKHRIGRYDTEKEAIESLKEYKKNNLLF